jgi:hypothetical protein
MVYLVAPWTKWSFGTTRACGRFDTLEAAVAAIVAAALGVCGAALQRSFSPILLGLALTAGVLRKGALKLF